MALPMNLTIWTESVTRPWEMVFFKQMAQAKRPFEGYLTTKIAGKGVKSKLDLMAWAPLGGMVKDAADSGADYDLDALMELGNKTITVDEYKLAVLVTERLLEDDDIGIVNKIPGALSAAANYSANVLGASVLLNAFDTNYSPISEPGVALCSASHVYQKDGVTTWSNLGTGALSPTTLKATITALELQKDHAQKPLGLIASRLVIPRSLLYTAQEVLQTTNQAYTSDYIKNVLPGLKIVADPYLDAGDINNWTLMAGESDCDLFFLWRTLPKFGSAILPATAGGHKTEFWGRMRCAVGFGEPFGIYGNQVA